MTTTPGFPWAKTLPARGPYALRTVDVDAPKAKTLADLETFVIAAASHGGAWLPPTFHEVCDRAAADYSTCMLSWVAIEDGLMGQFLDWLAAAGHPGGAPLGTVVENGTYSQLTLGYQQALQPHGVAATFYVNSGNVGSNPNLMSWAQLNSLASAGDEIGAKTVDATDLTSLTTQQQISEICDDRRTIIQHCIVPFTFAYPGGAFNTTIEVQNCGYDNARSAGSMSPLGSTYAETLPPTNWLALRAYAPTGQVTLSNLESLVTGAAATGGWVPIVIQKVCSSTLDPNNYATCTSYSGWIDLGDLNTFLTWVQSAGQTGGAPSGSVFKTIGAAAASADAMAPATSISCNGAPCQSTTYGGTVTVALTATDLGSGVASTHYTTDGTAPTLLSPVYNRPFSLTASTTVEYSSWDNAGNAEAVSTQAVSIQQPPDTTPPVTTIACNGGSYERVLGAGRPL